MKKFIGILLLVTLVAAAFSFTACTGGISGPVEIGDKVSVEYTGTLDDGTEFDSNVGKTPLEFTAGVGEMIAGFDRAVLGMKVGETKTVTIPADEAYGQPSEDLILEISRDKLPEGMDPRVGDMLPMTSAGHNFLFPVIRVSADSVTVDANHELAGEDLTFKIKLLKIRG